MSDTSALAVKLARVTRLLAEAAWRHPADPWVVRARELVGNLDSHFVPPCPGSFKEQPHCDEAHQHGLKCGNPADVCTMCHKTNAEHRTAWAALGYDRV